MIGNSGYNRTYGIIGAGMVGNSLASYLSASNKLQFIVSRSEGRIQNLLQSGITKHEIINAIEDISQLPDVLIIAVNDSSIKQVAEELANLFERIPFNKFVFHVSGSKTLAELSALNDYPCKIFTAHPFQTFYEYSPIIFKNLIWGVEKGKTDEDEIRDIITDLGGSSLFLNDQTIALKELYHLIAVSASNFLVSTIEFSKLLYEKAHLSNPNLVEKIIQTSVQNSLKYFSDNKNFPITGPLARTDLDTINNHLNALGQENDLRNIYSHFSLATAILLYKRNHINEEQYLSILNILNKD